MEANVLCYTPILGKWETLASGTEVFRVSARSLMQLLECWGTYEAGGISPENGVKAFRVPLR